MAKPKTSFSFVMPTNTVGYVLSELERMEREPAAMLGDETLSSNDVASILGVSTKTLERWRRLGTGPAWTRPEGSRVLYSRYAVDSFRATGRYKNSTEARLARAKR